MFVVRDRVRWSEVDKAGVMYFGAYVRFLELAETELYRELGWDYDDLDRADLWMPRVHLDFDFFKPAFLDEVLSVRSRVDAVGNRSITLRMEVVRESDETLLTTATVVCACVERRTWQSVPIPEELAERLRAVSQA